MNEAIARANTNIALVKYWGKRNSDLFLPMNSSISLTLDSFYTVTKVQLNKSLVKDRIILDGQVVKGENYLHITSFLEKIRKLSGQEVYADVVSFNFVPTAAGYASSASGFAALAAAGSRAYQLKLKKKELSIMARQGSGSACRSIYGGFVMWNKGIWADGRDSYAQQLTKQEEWPLSIISMMANGRKKDISSRKGMDRTIETSPLYQGWLNSVEDDLHDMIQAIKTKDFEMLGISMEKNCLKMHSTMMTANPPILYWNGITTELIHHVIHMRKRGYEAYFTIDAGPNVKVFCKREDEKAIVNVLKEVPGAVVKAVSHQGEGVKYLKSEDWNKYSEKGK